MNKGTGLIHRMRELHLLQSELRNILNRIMECGKTIGKSSALMIFCVFDTRSENSITKSYMIKIKFVTSLESSLLVFEYT